MAQGNNPSKGSKVMENEMGNKLDNGFQGLGFSTYVYLFLPYVLSINYR